MDSTLPNPLAAVGSPPELGALPDRILRGGEEGAAALARALRRSGAEESAVLLVGEPGTGRTRLARLLHEWSPRCREAFLTTDCGAFAPELIERELFGHAQGAFPGADRERPGKFAAAGRGTLVLDEVHALPPALQARLLGVLRSPAGEPAEGSSPPPRPRLIAVSSVPLAEAVAVGRFRADLSAVCIVLPPLRSRRPSVRPLSEKFLGEFAGRGGAGVRGIAADALDALERYAWPGNVRELRNVIERAVAVCPGAVLGVRDLPEAIGLADVDAPFLASGRGEC